MPAIRHWYRPYRPSPSVEPEEAPPAEPEVEPEEARTAEPEVQVTVRNAHRVYRRYGHMKLRTQKPKFYCERPERKRKGKKIDDDDFTVSIFINPVSLIF